MRYNFVAIVTCDGEHGPGRGIVGLRSQEKRALAGAALLIVPRVFCRPRLWGSFWWGAHDGIGSRFSSSQLQDAISSFITNS